MKYGTSFFVALFLTFSFAVAQATSDDDSVIQAWVSNRYQNCDSGFNDIIKTSLTPFQLISLRRIENGNCADSTSSTSCLQDLNNFFNSSYSSKADTYGCRRASASTAATLPPSQLKTDANIVCQPSDGKYGFTRQTGSGICHKKYDCSSDFSYVGQNFSSGTYDFTCVAHSDSCDGIGFGEGSCLNPTIQSIGFISDGKVQRLSYPTNGAQ